MGQQQTITIHYEVHRNDGSISHSSITIDQSSTISELIGRLIYDAEITRELLDFDILIDRKRAYDLGMDDALILLGITDQSSVVIKQYSEAQIKERRESMDLLGCR